MYRKERTQFRRTYSRGYSRPKQDSGIKGITISNLDYEVTEDDVREIFQKIGKVKKAIVHYNAQGQSRGTAIVYFHNPAHCIKAVNEYHQAEVDGRPMYVKALATVSGSSPVVKRTGRGRGRGGYRGRGRGRGGYRGSSNMRGRGRGRGRGGRTTSPTIEQLDKEMEDYHNMGGSAVDHVSAGQPDTAKLFSGDADGQN